MLASTDQWKKSVSLRFRRPSSTPWKTAALEIVEGLGKAVLLIASTVAVVVLSILLGGHVVAAVIVPQPRVPFRLVAGGHPLIVLNKLRLSAPASASFRSSACMHA
jgi:hypothetical protein